MAKERTSEWHRKKCVEDAKKIARIKANYKCAYCGLGEPQRQTHGSHIFSEGIYKSMSADVDNILCLCAIHHAIIPGRKPTGWNWHAYPDQSWEWFMSKYPELYQELKLRTQKCRKINWIKKREKLKRELKACT